MGNDAFNIFIKLCEENDVDKELLKKTEEYLKYLARCRSELQRIIKGK
jgi:hypothetical protein